MIHFEDQLVKSICIANWDTDGDGELSYEEAQVVQNIETAFKRSAIVALDELQYFSSVQQLHNYEFQNCRSLERITLPNQITSIGYWCFDKCPSLAFIEIPASVTSIGGYAFQDCANLTIYCKSAYPPSISGSTFNNTNVEYIIVPDESVIAYKNATNWVIHADKIISETDYNNL